MTSLPYGITPVRVHCPTCCMVYDPNTPTHPITYSRTATVVVQCRYCLTRFQAQFWVEARNEAAPSASTRATPAVE